MRRIGFIGVLLWACSSQSADPGGAGLHDGNGGSSGAGGGSNGTGGLGCGGAIAFCATNDPSTLELELKVRAADTKTARRLYLCRDSECMSLPFDALSQVPLPWSGSVAPMPGNVSTSSGVDGLTLRVSWSFSPQDLPDARTLDDVYAVWVEDASGAVLASSRKQVTVLLTGNDPPQEPPPRCGNPISVCVAVRAGDLWPADAGLPAHGPSITDGGADAKALQP
jgi:hypothetical protein